MTLDLGVGAREEQGDIGADVVAKGGFGRGEGGLGNEFIVLRELALRLGSRSGVWERESAYANGLEHVDEAWEVGDAVV